MVDGFLGCGSDLISVLTLVWLGPSLAANLAVPALGSGADPGAGLAFGALTGAWKTGFAPVLLYHGVKLGLDSSVEYSYLCQWVLNNSIFLSMGERVLS